MEANTDYWHRLLARVDEAFRLPTEARQAWLVGVRTSDPDLGDDLVRIIADDAAAGAFFDDLADGLQDALISTQEAADATPGRIGGYQLIRELGRGGMGTVYLARRDDGQYEQQVALKRIRHEVRADGLVARFLRERQILARLSHPHIAQLLDGGVTESGQPYFVMTYIDGQPLTAYCDAHRLGLNARLRLFLDVCAAVQYAHRNLIVHRDLKPSNILVTEAGQVKLLDFGIAKLLDPESLDGAAPMTQTRHVMLTPAYAAPEQVRGEAITTATDVYGLGILLYELLTGYRPFQLQGRSPAEVERIICTTDPTPPSAAVKHRTAASVAEAGTPDEVARARCLDGATLYRNLRGDLDNIVLMALRKAPTRRYDSVAALAEDVTRYLEARPVRARTGSVWYQVQKFVRRNQVAVAVGLLFVAVLLAYAATVTRQSQALAVERDRAQEEAAKAAQVSDLLVGLFDVSDPFSSEVVRGDTLRVQALLEGVEADVLDGLAAHPGVQAKMQTVLGRIYRNLALHDPAEAMLEAALRKQRSLYAAPHPDLAESLHQLGLLHAEQDDFAGARQHLREALAIRRQVHGGALDVASSLGGMGTAWYNEGVYDSAAVYFQGALALYQQPEADQPLPAERRPAEAEALNNLAAVLHRRGDFDGAEASYRQALALQQALLGPDHPLVAVGTYNLAVLRYDQGAYEEAEVLHRKALALKEAILGRAHPSVAHSLNSLARLYYSQGNYAEAERLYREALSTWRGIYGEAHHTVAMGMANLGMALRQQGAYDEAERLYRTALAVRKQVYGPAHPTVAESLTSLAVLLRSQGAYDAAEPLLREALALYQQLLDPGHPRIASTTYSLAALLAAQGSYEEAEQRFNEAHAIYRAALSQDHPHIATVLVGLSSLLVDRGRAEEAVPLLQEAVRIRINKLSVDHPKTAEAESLLSRAQEANRIR